MLSDWELVGLVGLVLWSVPLLFVGALVAREIERALVRHFSNRRMRRIIDRVEARQIQRQRDLDEHRIAERIMSDAELIASVQRQWLEECYALPCAPDGPSA